MPEQKKSKQEKRADREQAVVRQAIALFSDKGFLGVRMSDVAKACEVSMGTIYSHFAAKEDLLLACAACIGVQEQALYRKVIESEGPAMQRTVTGFTVNWLISQYHQDLIEIEHLSLMPSIWRRANPQRIAELNRVHESCFAMAQPLALEMLEHDLIGHADMDEGAREELAVLFNHGMWGLCVGLNSATNSGMARADEDGHEACSYKHFSTNVLHFLKGYGWNADDPQAVFDDCRRRAMAMLDGHPWFACPDADTGSDATSDTVNGEQHA